MVDEDLFGSDSEGHSPAVKSGGAEKDEDDDLFGSDSDDATSKAPKKTGKGKARDDEDLFGSDSDGDGDGDSDGGDEESDDEEGSDDDDEGDEQDWGTKILPGRRTRGRRQISAHLEGDDEFWSQEFFEEGTDNEYSMSDVSEDQVDSDFDCTEEEDEGEEDVKEIRISKNRGYIDPADLQRQRRAREAKAGVKRAPRPKRKPLPLAKADRTMRKSTQKRSISVEAARQKRLKEEKAKPRKKKKVIKVLTQQERLAEAAKMEIKNKKDLERLIAYEEDLKKLKAAPKVSTGPRIVWRSDNTGASTLTFTKTDEFPNELQPVQPPTKPQRCEVTGLPAKYRDPLSGKPYATIEAFKQLRISWLAEEEARKERDAAAREEQRLAVLAKEEGESGEEEQRRQAAEQERASAAEAKKQATAGKRGRQPSKGSKKGSKGKQAAKKKTSTKKKTTKRGKGTASAAKTTAASKGRGGRANNAKQKPGRIVEPLPKQPAKRRRVSRAGRVTGTKQQKQQALAASAGPAAYQQYVDPTTGMMYTQAGMAGGYYGTAPAVGYATQPGAVDATGQPLQAGTSGYAPDGQTMYTVGGGQQQYPATQQQQQHAAPAPAGTGGMYAVYDPATGQPIVYDPATGTTYLYDAASGQAIPIQYDPVRFAQLAQEQAPPGSGIVPSGAPLQDQQVQTQTQVQTAPQQQS